MCICICTYRDICVGWWVVLFYGVSILFGSFNAEYMQVNQ